MSEVGGKAEIICSLRVFRILTRCGHQVTFRPLPFPWLKPILWSVLSLGGALRRRDFIKVISGGAAVWPLSAWAQQPTMPVVGYLSAGTSSGDARPVAAFVKGLGETGYQDGKTVQIEYRWAENQYDRLSSIAADLVRQKVAVIAAVSTPAVRAAKAATATIPVVFTTIADPVQIGLVASLNRAGGNVTGVTMLSVEVGPKLLELLHGAANSARLSSSGRSKKLSLTYNPRFSSGSSLSMLQSLNTHLVNASCSVPWSMSSVHFTNSQRSKRVNGILPRKLN